jgi:1-acyl-sn-glycerol-3-phosphate acyltransferase
MDRPALGTAARVLREGGVVGIFPEGGIWKAGEKSAHRGVAWLSFTTGAPVVPVGFGGVYRAIGRAIRLEKPRLETWVGTPIAVPIRPKGTTRRDHMTAHAQRVLQEIDALVPAWDKEEHVEPEEELFDLEVRVGEREYRDSIAHPEILSEFFHTPVLVDVLYTNLKRHGVSPFRHFGRAYPPRGIAYAVAIILGYTIRTNPAFFTYRLGDEKAQRLTEALHSLRNLALQLAKGDGEGMRIVPIHRFRMPGASQWIVRRHPPKIERF